MVNQKESITYKVPHLPRIATTGSEKAPSPHTVEPAYADTPTKLSPLVLSLSELYSQLLMKTLYR